MDSPKNNEMIGENIKRVREKKGLTQEQVAKKIGMNTNYFAVYERGEHQPSPARLLKIAKALGVDISELLKGVK